MTTLRLARQVASPPPATIEPAASPETIGRLVAEVTAAHREIRAPQIGVDTRPSRVRQGRGQNRRNSA